MTKKKKSIITWTVQRISMVFFAVIAALVIFFLWYITRSMKEGILNSRKSQVEMGAGIMESRLEAMTGPIISLAGYTPAVRLASGYYREYTPKWMDAIRNVDAYLQNTSMFSSYITDINLIGEDGEAVYSLNDILKKDYPYTEQQWFQDALLQDTTVKYAPKSGKDHLYPSYQNYGNPSFSMIYPISRGNTDAGYVLMEIDLIRLAEFLGRELEKDTAYLIADGEGELIYPVVPEENQQQAASRIIEIPDQTAGNEGFSGIYQDKKYFYITDRLSVNGWSVILQTGKEGLLSPIRQLIAVSGLLFVVSAVLLLAILHYSTKRMGKPLQVLTERMNAYDGRKPEQTETYENAPAEVAVIGERFEAMAGKISDLIQDVYVAELRQKEAELDALVNQINPHFLYNVLQLIETMAVLADNREIEDMIQALSQMMRYTMERGEKKVHVREELEYIHNYLMFYQKRFPDMFSYEISCPEQLKEARILKFVVQPVVENSIRHGFDQTRTDGRLLIRVEEQGDDLVITVWDNGRGISLERMEQLQSGMKEAEENPAARRGIGVINTDTRIRLVYGEEYGLSMESKENEYTSVTIRTRLEGDQDV